MPDGAINGYGFGDLVTRGSKETLGDPVPNTGTDIQPIWKIFGDGWNNSAMAESMGSLMADLAAQNASLGRKLMWSPGKIDSQGRPTMKWKLRYPDGRVTWGDVRRARGPGKVPGEAPKIRPPEHRHRDNAKIVKAYQAGRESVSAIAKRYGVSSRTVYVLVDEAGVPKRAKFSGAQKNTRPKRPVQRDETISVTEVAGEADIRAHGPDLGP